MREEKLKEVLSDKDFFESLINMKNHEERRLALKEKGVDVTVEEIEQVRAAVVKLNAAGGIGPNGEIDETLLGDVAGGIVPLIVGFCSLVVSIETGGLAILASKIFC